MVVGTNAFIAYSLLCNARFPPGVEETEDFDLAWCRGSGVSLTRAAAVPPERSSVRTVLAGAPRATGVSASVFCHQPLNLVIDLSE